MLSFCFCLVLDLGVFLLCFPWLTQSGAKDSVLSENWCFRLRPAFWGGEEAWRRAQKQRLVHLETSNKHVPLTASQRRSTDAENYTDQF